MYGGRRFATESEVRNFVIDILKRHGYMPLADEQDLKYITPAALGIDDMIGLIRDAALAILGVLKTDDFELNRVLELCRWCVKIAAKSDKADFKEILTAASEALSVSTTIETAIRGVESEEDLNEIIIRALRVGRFERGFTMRLRGFLTFTGFLAAVPEVKALKGHSERGFRKAYAPTILTTFVDLLHDDATADISRRLIDFHIELRRRIMGILLNGDQALQNIVRDLQPCIDGFIINVLGKDNGEVKRAMSRRLKGEIALTAVHLYRYGFKTRGVLRVLEDGFVKGLLTL